MRGHPRHRWAITPTTWSGCLHVCKLELSPLLFDLARGERAPHALFLAPAVEEPRGHQSGGWRALFAFPPFPHGRNRSRAMPGEVLQRGAPRGHHSPLPTSPPPAPPLTCSRLSLHPTTPWQVLRANPSTYEGHPGGYDYLLFELRSDLPRGWRGAGGGISCGARSRARRGTRVTERRPVGQYGHEDRL